ncbi:hypothetical protein F8M41_023665 [Gigaspora margarita]|uniref:Uncharacterized protein n=1 Tax=Gigaspora margarita TaxID=4874 RepID=A0A8H4EGU9_GIGMA|nr:hypothetical protein F8M41_023665 [Gigaspora margarita]
MFIIADLGNVKSEFLLYSTKETHDSSNRKRSTKKISKEVARQIKVVEEQERCKQILDGYIKLKEQLPPTLHKMSNVELLKKGGLLFTIVAIQYQIY